jgi:hypothetical protein
VPKPRSAASGIPGGGPAWRILHTSPLEFRGRTPTLAFLASFVSGSQRSSKGPHQSCLCDSKVVQRCRRTERERTGTDLLAFVRCMPDASPKTHRVESDALGSIVLGADPLKERFYRQTVLDRRRTVKPERKSRSGTPSATSATHRAPRASRPVCELGCAPKGNAELTQ